VHFVGVQRVNIALVIAASRAMNQTHTRTHTHTHTLSAWLDYCNAVTHVNTDNYTPARNGRRLDLRHGSGCTEKLGQLHGFRVGVRGNVTQKIRADLLQHTLNYTQQGRRL